MAEGVKITRRGREGGKHGNRHLISVPSDYIDLLHKLRDELEAKLGMPLTLGQVVIHLINKERKANG